MLLGRCCKAVWNVVIKMCCRRCYPAARHPPTSPPHHLTHPTPTCSTPLSPHRPFFAIAAIITSLWFLLSPFQTFPAFFSPHIAPSVQCAASAAIITRQYPGGLVTVTCTQQVGSIRAAYSLHHGSIYARLPPSGNHPPGLQVLRRLHYFNQLASLHWTAWCLKVRQIVAAQPCKRHQLSHLFRSHAVVYRWEPVEG